MYTDAQTHTHKASCANDDNDGDDEDDEEVNGYSANDAHILPLDKKAKGHIHHGIGNIKIYREFCRASKRHQIRRLNFLNL